MEKRWIDSVEPLLRIAGMKLPQHSASAICLKLLCLLSLDLLAPIAFSADVPELDKLRVSYKAAVARGTKSILQAHITNLEKLRDIYTRGSNLQGAAKVQADIDRANVAMTTGEFLPPSADADNVLAPELDKLRTRNEAEIERALKPFRETYLRELDKVRDSYTRAANLAAATAVQAEIDDEKSASKPQGRAEKFFAGKSWWTPVNSEYRFGRVSTGERIDVKGVTTAFTWRKLKTGIIEVTGSLAPGGPPVNWYFKFDNYKSALMGDRPDLLQWTCRSEK